MRRGLRVLLLWAVLLLVLMIGGAAVAEQTPSCTITVQPGESIQAAIDAAPEGAVICLPAGEWQAELRISKSLTLRGAGAERTTIRGKSLDGPVSQPGSGRGPDGSWSEGRKGRLWDHRQ